MRQRILIGGTKQEDGRGKESMTTELFFVGTDHAGENLAGLYSLIATCGANGVNPVDHQAAVLLRVQTHPASRIDELLPHNWKPPRLEPSA